MILVAKEKSKRQRTTKVKLMRPSNDDADALNDNPPVSPNRANKYSSWITEAGLERLQIMAWQGWTDEKIAKFIGVSASTLREWKNRYPAVAGALKKDKLLPAAEMLRSFEQNSTTGYEWDEVTTFETWDAEAGCWVMKDRKTVHKFRPPETTAQIFGLKNLLPEHFRDRVELQQDVPHVDDGFTAAMDKAAGEVFSDGFDTPANIDD